MYELWIKKNDGVWTLADLPNDTIAMIYQAKDIGELNTLKGSISQRIRLPITKTNCEIFDYINEHDVVSDIPYKKLECRLYCDGISLASGGALPNSSPQISILRVSNTFECQIRDSSFNIFNWLKMLQFKESDDDGFLFPELGSFVREKKTIAGSIIQNGVGFGALASSENVLTLTDESFTYDRAVPYVKFTMMLDLVSQLLGLEFVYDIPGIEKIATLVTNIKTDENSLNPYIGTAEQNRVHTPPGGNPIRWGEIYDDASGNMYIDEQEQTMLYYNAPFDGSAFFQASDYASIRTIGTLEVKNLATNTEVKKSFSYASGPANIQVEFTKGDKIRIRVLNGSSSNDPLENVRLTMHSLKTDDEIVPIGGRVSIRENLGFNNFIDYLKAMVEALGLFVDYDASKHIMYLAIADNIYKNKEKAINWSKKLHHGDKGATSYTALDYAQSNSINFEDDKNTGFKDSITFYVDNENLKGHKDLFKLKFEAGDNKNVFGNWTINGKTEEQNFLSAIVPLYKVEDNELKFIGSGKPRIVFVDNKVNLVVNGISFPHVKNAMASELISTFYDKLINGILKKSKVRDDEFNLTSQDIEDYNQFIPVYIDYYGAYFYVNKIHNFMKGEKTLCDLIQL